MVQDSTTFYVWIGGSCDYGHKGPTHVSVPRETGETKGVKSRDQTCLGFALQEPMEQRAQSQTCLSYAKS